MERIVTTNKEPRLLELLELMLDNRSDTCIIKAVSPMGLVTLEVNILEFLLKEDVQ
jgi:hypothetical protein